MQNVYIPPSDCLQDLVRELRDEVKSLKYEILDMKKEIIELKDGNKRSLVKLTEEVIAVKLENRKHHHDNALNDEYIDSQKLPLVVIDDLKKFDKEVQENEDKLRQFVSTA